MMSLSQVGRVIGAIKSLEAGLPDVLAIRHPVANESILGWSGSRFRLGDGRTTRAASAGSRQAVSGPRSPDDRHTGSQWSGQRARTTRPERAASSRDKPSGIALFP